MEGFSNPKVSGFLDNILTKLGKIPGFGKFAKDAKTYQRLFGEAAEISAKGAKMKVFRKSGGLLTRMQRKGLLNRTKLYIKFIGWATGIGIGEEAIANMSEDEMNEKFMEYASSEEGMEDIENMPPNEQNQFIKILQEILASQQQ
tara:strand:- start:257 stop:691 length:435 start_codon:yes stop_codon:yes gene_type:complete